MSVDPIQVQEGRFHLVEEQPLDAHPWHELHRRVYPKLDAPAVFVDCWTCHVTWEVGR